MSHHGAIRTVRRDAAPTLWRFGAAVLNDRTLELRVGERLVELERKPLEILMFLLQHAGEVILKDRLVEAVWPGRIVSDSNLTKCVAVLRNAIEDREQTVIKTVHGYGYRLAAPVEIESLVPSPAPAAAAGVVAQPS